VDGVPAAPASWSKSGATGPTGYSFGVEGTSAGNLAARHSSSSRRTTCRRCAVETTASIADGALHHPRRRVNRTSNTISIYLDGVLQQTTSTANVGDISNTGRRSIGHNSQTS